MAPILFVGSGLSIHFGISGWYDVLSTVARSELTQDKAQEVNRVLTIPDSEYKAASLLATYLGGENHLNTKISRFLEIQQSRIERQRLLRVKPHLMGPQSIGIITTNWDTLLTTLGGFELLCWPEDRGSESYHLKQVVSCIRQSKRFVWHLHGALGKSQLVVTDQQRKIREEAIQRNEDFLSGLLSSYDIYAIGSGFPDSHLRSLFRKCEQRGAVVHALMPQRSKAITNLGDFARLIDIKQFPDLKDFKEALCEFSAVTDTTYELVGLDNLRSFR